MTMVRRFKEILDVCLTADRMARSIGHRFVPDPEKLKAMGMSEVQIISIQFQLAEGFRADGEEMDK